MRPVARDSGGEKTFLLYPNRLFAGAFLAAMCCLLATAYGAEHNSRGPAGNPLRLARIMGLFDSNPPGSLAYPPHHSAATRFSFRLRFYEHGSAAGTNGAPSPARVMRLGASAYRDGRVLVMIEHLYGGYICYSGRDGRKRMEIGFDPKTPRNLYFSRGGGFKLEFYADRKVLHLRYGVRPSRTGPSLRTNLSYCFNRDTFRHVKQCRFDGGAKSLVLVVRGSVGKEFANLDCIFAPRPWRVEGYSIRRFSDNTYGPDGSFQYAVELRDIRVQGRAKHIPLHLSLAGLRALGFRLTNRKNVLPPSWRSSHALVENRSARKWAVRFEQWLDAPQIPTTKASVIDERKKAKNGAGAE